MHEGRGLISRGGIDLLGYSMGGGIATVFAATFPEKVLSLNLCAPVGFPSLRRSTSLLSMTLVSQVPTFISMYAIGKYIVGAPYSGQEEFSRNSVVFKDLAKKWDERQKHEKCLQWSLVSTIQNFPMGELGRYHKIIASEALFPILILWGTCDSVVPFQKEEVENSIPMADIRLYKNGGHGCILDDTDWTVKQLCSINQLSPNTRRKWFNRKKK